MKFKVRKNHLIVILVSAVLAGPASSAGEAKKSLTFRDMMQFRSVSGTVISEDGTYVAYALQPGRGDGEVKVHRPADNKIFSIARGGQPVFAKNALWLAAAVKPKAEEMEKPEKDRPKNGMALLDLASGKETHFDKVEKSAFSNDSKWLAYQHFKEEEPAKKNDQPKEKDVGTTLVLRRLATGEEVRIPHVLSFAFNESGSKLACAVSDPDGKSNGLFVRDLSKSDLPEKAIAAAERTVFSQLAWQKKGDRLAYLRAAADEKGNAGPRSPAPPWAT